MHNSAYKLLKQIKKASMGSGSFLPPEPLPNSVKAKQIEQQELAAEQSEANAGAGNDQLMQMQKAQEDAVNELQQTKQQLVQAQSELQNSQAQAQQQQQAAEMQAQQEIQKAQMDAQYELQSEKIKNQQQLLSMQEKFMRSAGKEKPDQNHILSNQLKRVVKKVNSMKMAAAGVPATPLNPTGGPRDSVVQNKDTNILSSEKKFQGLPHANVMPSQRTQQQWNEISDWKKNRVASDPRMQQAKTQVMSAPINNNNSNSFIGDYANEVGNYWADPKSYMEKNQPGLHNNTLWNMTGGFVTDINSGFSNIGRGNITQGLKDLGAGYVQGLGTVSLGGWGVGGLARLGAKALPSAAGALGRVAGAANAASAASNVLMGAPGRLMAQGAGKVLPAALAKPFQSGLATGALNLYAGHKIVGMASPNNPNELQQNYDNTLQQELQQPSDNLNYGDQSYGNQGYGGYAPSQQWDTGLSPAERFSVMNRAQDQARAEHDQYMNMYNKNAADATVPGKEPVYPDIRKFMKNPPPPGAYIPSPIPIWQSGFRHRDINMPESKQQGYGPLGNFIKDLIFQVGLPMVGIRNPFQPDFSKVYGSLANNEAYKLKVPHTFNYY